MGKKSAIERFCEEAETEEDRKICEILREIPPDDKMMRKAVLNYAKSARESE